VTGSMRSTKLRDTDSPSCLEKKVATTVRIESTSVF
jgi:hypothetical protein